MNEKSNAAEAAGDSSAHRLQVPYPTVVSFKRALKLLAKLPDGFIVERAFLLKNRIPPNAVYPVLHALRFLGLTGPRHATRAELASFLEDGAMRARIILAAYEPLIRRIVLPVADRKELVGLMKPEVSSSPSVVPLAATFFMWAMSTAGEPAVRKTLRRPGPGPGLMRAPIRLRGERGAELKPVGRQDTLITFQIQVDKSTTSAQIERMIDDIQQACARRG